MYIHAHQVCTIIQKQFPDFKPKIGVILGSGLGSFAEQLTDNKKISYATLPGFPSCDVKGHAGTLSLGYLGNTGVVCMQGRAHSYEGMQNEVVKTYVRTFKLLGCEQLLIVNAAGSLREDVAPGELVLINDHINLQPTNPLVGKNDEEFGPRFFPLDKAYDLDMRKKLQSIASQNSINLHEGVYIATLGPNYETAAEIRAFKVLGADVVGMSTVPEVLVASHCGLKVAVISTITNFATGLTTISHSHDEVVKTAAKAASKLNILLSEFVHQY
ncbi:MAG: purine-nucleoside phosphorylase [Chitinophagia bacterium]|nr:purine-nucleoside phosphorylase [Chitinophagia bacterium]